MAWSWECQYSAVGLTCEQTLIWTHPIIQTIANVPAISALPVNIYDEHTLFPQVGRTQKSVSCWKKYWVFVYSGNLGHNSTELDFNKFL